MEIDLIKCVWRVKFSDMIKTNHFYLQKELICYMRNKFIRKIQIMESKLLEAQTSESSFLIYYNTATLVWLILHKSESLWKPHVMRVGTVCMPSEFLYLNRSKEKVFQKKYLFMAITGTCHFQYIISAWTLRTCCWPFLLAFHQNGPILCEQV